MPELPEVERAAKLTRHVALGRKIKKIQTWDDTIVYTDGITSNDFRKEVIGRTVTGVGRYGKLFYLELDGTGRTPVFHLGMTGMIQVKGQEPTWYRTRNKDLSADVWPPPRFLKFILHLEATNSETANELAFLDARRLGRIRLVKSPLTEPPISQLGFDPILSMPTIEEFKALVLKRTCPIKALLLDQSFSAGVGNWVADEVLYQARVHPEQRANTLAKDQLDALYEQTKAVCEAAVAVNADSTQFPANWLFNYRWGKGQKNNANMTLPDGQTASIKWLTVGGRTSAVVEQLQKIPDGGRDRKKQNAHVDDAEDSDEDEDDEEYGKAGPSNPRTTKTGKRKARRRARKADDASAEDDDSSDLTQDEDDEPGPPRSKKARMVAETSTVFRSTRSTAQTVATTSTSTTVVATTKKSTSGAKKASAKK